MRLADISWVFWGPNNVKRSCKNNMYTEQAKSPCSPDITVVQMGEVQTQVDPLGMKAKGQFPNLSKLLQQTNVLSKYNKRISFSTPLQLVPQN